MGRQDETIRFGCERAFGRGTNASIKELSKRLSNRAKHSARSAEIQRRGSRRDRDTRSDNRALGVSRTRGINRMRGAIGAWNSRNMSLYRTGIGCIRRLRVRIGTTVSFISGTRPT